MLFKNFLPKLGFALSHISGGIRFFATRSDFEKIPNLRIQKQIDLPGRHPGPKVEEIWNKTMPSSASPEEFLP